MRLLLFILVASFLLSTGSWSAEDQSRDSRLSKWLPLAEEGDASAQKVVGDIYDIVPRDYEEALKWYRLAAEQGYVPAMSDLGAHYLIGAGVPMDYVLAYMWFNLAAAKNGLFADLKRDDLAEKMTASQIEKAQDLSRECVRKNYKGC